VSKTRLLRPHCIHARARSSSEVDGSDYRVGIWSALGIPARTSAKYLATYPFSETSRPRSRAHAESTPPIQTAATIADLYERGVH
jgi:hypothetical protein